MQRFYKLARLAMGAAVVLAIAGFTGSARAQVGITDPDAAVACGAFQRWGGGAWTAMGPTILDYDNGMSLAVAAGETFIPGSTIGGVEVTATLNRHCGNL